MKSTISGRLADSLLGIMQPSSVENRMTLAADRVEHGMFAEAVRLYESCLKSRFASDAATLYSCARAYFFNGEARHAGKILARLEKVQPTYRREDRVLLQARVRDSLLKKVKPAA